MRRRLMLRNASGGGLPSGYRQVRCISIPLGGYIITDVIAVKGDVITADARLDSDLSLNSINPIYSSYNGAGNMAVFALERNQKPYAQYNFRYSCIGSNDNLRHVSVLDTNNNLLRFDDLQANIGCEGDTTSKIALSGRYNGNGTVDRKTATTFWRFSVFNGGIAKCDYVPCEQISSGLFGMYDLTTNTFYGNSGTGQITEGVE